MEKTFITHLPDESGMLLKASDVISQYNGNIIRVSYNKSLDVHTLFLSVSADDESIFNITNELEEVGFLQELNKKEKIILIVLKLEDKPGSIKPILKILKEYEVNISYINSQENGTKYQYFKMGLFIEKPQIMKSLLDDISMICDIKVIDNEGTSKILDNTIFYLNFANEISKILKLNQDEANYFIINSNKIMQILEENNEDPRKTFTYIKKYANFVANHKGKNFNSKISKNKISSKTNLYLIEPPCGSNTYIFESENELLFIDNGFNCFKNEMEDIFNKLFPNFNDMKKNIILTHGDIDHIGLSYLFDSIYVSENVYKNFKHEKEGKTTFREENILHEPYEKLSKLISNYTPPDMSKLKIIGKKITNDNLEKIGKFNFKGIEFDIYEGSGGHVKGEIILTSPNNKLIFTGDLFVNIKGFSKEQYEFNSIAPYLMTHVDMDSTTARKSRKEIINKTKDYLVCPGHGKWVYNNF